MNIQTVVRTEGYAVPGQVYSLYGTEARRPFEGPPAVRRVEVPGPREMDILYQYRVTEGWQGEIPLSLTYLVASRSYSQSTLVYQEQERARPRYWLA